MQLTRLLTVTLLLILITHYVNASLQQITFQDKVSKPADDKPVTITCGAEKFIHVKWITFGANCPKYDYDWNSVLHDWQKKCNGRSTCNRQIPHSSDTGCEREFEYSYLCSDSNLIIKGELKDDGTYNYWADGRFVYLHCPPHNYIQIVSAIYGQNKGQSLSDNSIRLYCDGNPTCMRQIIPQQFGNGALKRGDYQYEYMCVQKVHGKVDKPANGKTIKLECGTDEFIHVHKAVYAANCPNLIPDYQYAMVSGPRWELQKQCDGRQTCEYIITGLADPAPTCDTNGGREYDCFYVCSKSDSLILQKIDTILENVIYQIHIECPPNHSIKMVYAMYNSIRNNPVNDPNMFTECHGKLERCDYEIVLSKITTTIPALADYKYKYICVSPTPSPTLVPTQSPTFMPTISTIDPTISPTVSPTIDPTASPTASPTADPSQSPTISPTTAPTYTPTTSPNIPSAAINSSSAMSTNKSSTIPTMNPTISTSNPTSTNVVTQQTSSPTRHPIMISPTPQSLSDETTTTTSVPTVNASQKESTKSESGLSGGTIAAIVIGVSNLMAMIIISYLYKTGFFNHSSSNHNDNDNPTEKEPLRNKNKKEEIDIEREISVSDPGSPPPFDPSEYDHFDDEYLDLHLEDD